jgi:hypothetical protein
MLRGTAKKAAAHTTTISERIDFFDDMAMRQDSPLAAKHVEDRP